MASVSVSHTIVFVASIIVAASVAGVLSSEVGRLTDAIDDQGLDLSQKVRTDVEVISDGGSSNCCYDAVENNVTVLVKNTGSREIPAEADAIDVLINGTYRTDVSVRVVDGTEWDPENVVEVTVSGVSLPSGDHRVKLIVSGDEEVFEFRV